MSLRIDGKTELDDLDLRSEPIGTAGFEPATPATPLQCATGLRHVPNDEGGILARGRDGGKGDHGLPAGVTKPTS